MQKLEKEKGKGKVKFGLKSKYLKNIPSKASHGFSIQTQNTNHRISHNDSGPSFGNNKMDKSMNDASHILEEEEKNEEPQETEQSQDDSKNQQCQQMLSLVENIKDKDPAVLEAVLELFQNLVINKDKGTCPTISLY